MVWFIMRAALVNAVMIDFSAVCRLSVGWNSGASASMTGADAVIGRFDASATAPVLEYSISGVLCR